MTDASQTRFASIVEATYGVTPSTPTFLTKRITSERFKPSIQYSSSDELRADRNVSDLTQVGAAAGGGYDFELSYGSFDAELESAFQGTWTTNVLKNASTLKSFTHEKKFMTGGTDQYHRYTGQVANTLSLNIEAGKRVTGSLDFLGKSMSAAQTIITGATYTAPNTNPTMNAATNFASLSLTGVTAPAITKIGLNIDNKMRQQPIVGSLYSKGVGSGRFVVTGSLEAYFENQEMLDLYLNDTASALAFSIGGASTLKYAISLPKIKFTDAEILAGGNDTDVMAKMAFQAYYDSTALCTMQITRTP